MVNRWTGAYDAVLELASSGADLLLAALHRQGHPPVDAPPEGFHLLHGGSLNLPLPSGPLPGVSVSIGPLAGGPAGAGGADLRGHLRIQASTPSIRVPQEAGSARVTAVVEVFARFQPALGSGPAPEFVHGTLSVTAGISLVECEGATLAKVSVQSDDVRASFAPAPGSGLGPAEVALVEHVVVELVRRGLQPVQVRVSALGSGDFAVRELALKTLRAGSKSAFALLLRLKEPAGPAPDPAQIGEIFLGAGDHAALALGREFVAGVLRELALAPLSAIRVRGSRFGVDFEARPDPATLVIELRPGALRARVEGSGSLDPGGSFGFRLAQDFGLAVRGGELRLTLPSEPELEITQGNPLLKLVFGLFEGKIVGALEDAAQGLVRDADAELNRIVGESVGGLLAQLAIPGAELEFTRASIDPDGVILGGVFEVGPPPGVAASFTRSNKRRPGTDVFLVTQELDAFASWIPGGTVERYRWSEVRADGSVARQFDERHRFVTPIQPEVALAGPARAWPPTSWCLEVVGTQVVSGPGSPVPVSARTCGITVAVPTLDLPRGERLALRVPDGRGGVLADLDPWGSYRPHAFANDREERGFLLVHHAATTEGANALRAALAGAAARSVLVFPTVILEGRGHGCPRELADLALTHDPEGTWRKRFGLERPGATVLLGPGGGELWRDAGPLRSEELAKVLAGLRPGTPRLPRWNPVRLGLELGELAPDFLFPCGPQVLVATRKLRGREILICFWTTWSDAALEELSRLAAASSARAGDGKDGPLVLCVNDGEDSARAEAALKERGLDLALVPDPDRAIARRYGVTCWPTVVRLDRGGRIAGIRFGLELEPAAYAAGVEGREG